MFSAKAARYAEDAVRLSPGEKGCKWILNKTRGHAVWDWNLRNHTAAINFYREICDNNPGLCLPHYYLLDNLIADRRADEAEKVLGRLSTIKDADPVLCEAYRAHIALARFDEPAADAIIDAMLAANGENSAALFEAAQYYADKCDYDRAIELYELSFSKSDCRPRFQDELMAIADIYEIKGDCAKAAEAYGRIVDLLQNEWHMTEEVELKKAMEARARLLAKAQ